MDEDRKTEMGRDAPDGGATGSDLGGLLGSLLGGSREEVGSGISADAMRDGIGAVLSDPQMMAKLPGMIEMLRPLMGGGAGGDSAPSEQAVKDEKASPPAVPILAAEKGRGGCHDRRIALLRALRPYMNERRQEVIDYILRMDQMGKLFRGG